ncbi:MAG: collagen-like protein [Candidatus Solibacter sp.]|nr:collagen-like protein [Candidatus Solibacter sp.]
MSITDLRSDVQELTAHLASCNVLLQAEQERRQSVETRLTTIIGLSSIAGTIVLGTMFTPHAVTGTERALLSLGLLYLALQVSSAILAAVRGLGRRSYLAPTPAHVLPGAHEAATVHLRRQISACLLALADHQVHTNDKVTHMAVAHRALKNFVFGLLFLAALGTWHRLTSTPPDELLDRVRKEHVLQELLRGPQGPQGLRGPTGPAGPAGPTDTSKNHTTPPNKNESKQSGH